MKSARRLVGATWLAIWTAIAAPALGQETAKHAVTSATKVLVDNPRTAAGEATCAGPGTQDANIARPARVIRGLVGGTLTVVYADGRTEKRTFEPGGVYYFDPDTVANYFRGTTARPKSRSTSLSLSDRRCGGSNSKFERRPSDAVPLSVNGTDSGRFC